MAPRRLVVRASDASTMSAISLPSGAEIQEPSDEDPVTEPWLPEADPVRQFPGAQKLQLKKRPAGPSDLN